MARPHYDPSQPKARELLIGAFWDLLFELPYPNISVRELCRRAKVNKNTFYYHFENLDSLAREAIDTALFKNLGILLSSKTGFTKEEIAALMETPEMQVKVKRASILLSPNGAALRDTASQQIINVWCELLGDTEIDGIRMLHMQFLVGGLLNVLSGHNAQEFPSILDEIAEFEEMPVLIGSLQKVHEHVPSSRG